MHVPAEPVRAAGPGVPLDRDVRQRMEQRLGHSLDDVRIHDGGPAHEAARRAGAQAYTVGEHVIFGARMFVPGTPRGDDLLLHELTHVIQQRGAAAAPGTTAPGDAAERGATAMVRDGVRPLAGSAPRQVARVPIGGTATSTATTSPHTRTDLDRLRTRLAQIMVTVSIGTSAEQVAEVASRPGAAANAVDPATWSAYDPGPVSPVYAEVGDAILDFGRGLGLPPIDSVLFFDHAYRLGPTGHATPDPSVESEVHGRSLHVFRAVTGAGVRRALAQGVVSHVTDRNRGVPTTDPTLAEDFARAAGWVPAPSGAASPMLLDIGRPITTSNWTDAGWVEQPLTWYMASSPDEDLAEAISFFLTMPATLLLRSPRRHAFVNARRSRWAAGLRAPTPPAGAAATPLPATMPRADFDNMVRTTFGVGSVRDGTYAEQDAGVSTRRDLNPPGQHIPQAQWVPWNATPADDIYPHIVNALRTVAAQLGGLPTLTDIVFFTSDWGPDRSGTLAADTSTGASYGVGTLTIYRGATQANRTATTRSQPGVATTFTTLSTADAIVHNITHELGHGVEHTTRQPGQAVPAAAGQPPQPARAPADPTLQADYERTVGWLGYHAQLGPAVLLDSGAPVTATNWSDPSVVEKPPSAAAVAGPAADLTESMVAYATDRLTLQGRSPARYRFLQAREATWRPALVQPGPEPQGPGDFPAPRGDSVPV